MRNIHARNSVKVFYWLGKGMALQDQSRTIMEKVLHFCDWAKVEHSSGWKN